MVYVSGGLKGQLLVSIPGRVFDYIPETCLTLGDAPSAKRCPHISQLCRYCDVIDWLIRFYIIRRSLTSSRPARFGVKFVADKVTGWLQSMLHQPTNGGSFVIQS